MSGNSLDRAGGPVAPLPSGATDAEHELRFADREREYQARARFLDGAIASEPVQGDAPFLALLSKVREIVAEVHLEGYAIVRGVLVPEQVDRVRDGLEPLFATTHRSFARLDPVEPRQTVHIHNVLAKTRAADEVAVNPILRATIGGILGYDFLLHAGAVVMAQSPGCSPQPLHRDDASYAILPRPRMPLVLTAAFALDDFTERNGATRIVPRSCWWPGSRRPVPSEVIRCEMPAGSMLLWDGAMFHGGGGNITKSESRRTLTFNYTRGWLRTQFNQFLSVPRELALTLAPDIQKDLGYRPSAKGLGECDNQDPLVYLRRLQSRGGDGAQAMLGPEKADES